RGARQVDAGALPPLEPGVVDADAPTVARRPDAGERAGHPDEREAVALELHLIGLDVDGGLAGHPDDVRREVVDARRIDRVQRPAWQPLVAAARRRPCGSHAHPAGLMPGRAGRESYDGVLPEGEVENARWSAVTSSSSARGLPAPRRRSASSRARPRWPHGP